MSLDQFFDYCNGISGDRPRELRLGQYAFNLLHEAYPEVAGAICGTEYDPFYIDDRMPAFLSYILLNFVR